MEEEVNEETMDFDELRTKLMNKAKTEKGEVSQTEKRLKDQKKALEVSIRKL